MMSVIGNDNERETPMLNVPLIQKVLDHITAHPDEHDQNAWGYRETPSCKTQFCFAGHALNIAGKFTLVWYQDHPGQPEYRELAGVIPRTPEGDRVLPTYNTPPPDDLLPVSQAAASEMGLSHREAGMLFSGRNTLRDLWHLANDICGGQLIIPLTFQDPPGVDDE